MSNTTKEPSSAPALLFRISHKRATELRSQPRGGRHEPASENKRSSLRSRDLDSLTEEQLRKLTKANTRKNHGGRSSRLRSQVERVFRRLDNLAADVKLQPRYSIEALPVVSPDEPSTPQSKSADAKESDSDAKFNSDQNTNSGCDQKPANPATEKNPATIQSHEAQQAVDPLLLENEEFEIEPASVSIDLLSPMGAQPGSARSVRISTSVTVLDYNPMQPVSVAQMQRFHHPTRTGKSLQTRRVIAEEMNTLSRALQRLDQIRQADNQIGVGDIARRHSALEDIGPRTNRPSPPPPRRVRSVGSTPTSTSVGPFSTGAKNK